MVAKMKLGTKLSLAFLLVAAISITIGGFSLLKMQAMNTAEKKIAEVRLPSIMALNVINEAQTAVQASENSQMDPVNVKNQDVRKTDFDRIAAKFKAADEAWKIYAPLEQSDDEKLEWDKFVPLWEEWKKRDAEYISIVREQARMFDAGVPDNDPRMLAIEKKKDSASRYVDEAFAPTEASIAKLLDINSKNATADDNNFNTTAASARLTMMIVIGIGVLLTILLSLYFTKNVNGIITQLLSEMKKLAEAALNGDLKTRASVEETNFEFQPIVVGVNNALDALIAPLNMAAEYVNRISKGDIPPAITEQYKGDFNEIKNNLNQCIASLKGLLEETGKLSQAVRDKRLDIRGESARYQGSYGELVKGINEIMDTMNESLLQVVSSVDQVTSASGQISASAQSVSEGASEQASSIEEITSSLEEMASMTKQNADNAAQAQNLSRETYTSTERGNIEMERMNESIEEIKRSSDQTAKIVKTIDEIAFQTNLLALNAAVEAARAGEAGKGFAVVAEEVRKLAMRSAEAAKNTASMIEEAVKNAENGVRIVAGVGAVLKEIGKGSEKVNNLVAEIAAASREQAQGIDQVNMAMGQLDKVTQSNAANAEESASASEELTSQASVLSEMVGAFTLVGLSSRSSAGASAMKSSVFHHNPSGKSGLTQHGNGGNGKRTSVTASVLKQFAREDARKSSATAVIPLDDEDFNDFDRQ